jgi:hypothetical protein
VRILAKGYYTLRVKYPLFSEMTIVTCKRSFKKGFVGKNDEKCTCTAETSFINPVFPDFFPERFSIDA